nr:hypothetical protein [Lentzea aerocolonigenes]
MELTAVGESSGVHELDQQRTRESVLHDDALGHRVPGPLVDEQQQHVLGQHVSSN